MQKEIEKFLEKRRVKFSKNYEGSKVPFSHELNMESVEPVYYLFEYKIIITAESEEYTAKSFIEKEGWKFINFKEARSFFIN